MIENAIDDNAAGAAPYYDTLLSGYTDITGKYIDDIAPGVLAEEGLRGLAAIDPAMAIRHTDANIELLRGDVLVMRTPAPDKNDLVAWTALSVDAIEAATNTSPEMAVASPERIYEAIFDSALSNLDVFSRYAGAKEARINREKRDGFGGIGIEFRLQHDVLSVLSVVDDSPASNAGIQPGDAITHINNTPVAKLSRKSAAERLRGPINSIVGLTIRRSAPNTAPKTIKLARALIVPDTVTSRVDDGVLVIGMDGFNRKTAQSLLAHIEKAQSRDEHPLKGIILDMRGNPGGLLDQSINVVNVFLASGQIMSTTGRHPNSNSSYRASGTDRTGGLPLVVLVDGRSASAAEIVAAALQDQSRAVVIGTTSYGKGTVQTVVHLPNDGEITLTWSRLITPSGYAFHGLGVPPVVCTSYGGESQALLSAALAHASDQSRLLQAWRSPLPETPDTRRALRAACPAERRTPLSKAENAPPADLEIELARTILGNTETYLRALRISAHPFESAEARP